MGVILPSDERSTRQNQFLKLLKNKGPHSKLQNIFEWFPPLISKSIEVSHFGNIFSIQLCMSYKD